MQGVAYSPEFSRVSALPRRTWTDEEAQASADALTPVLARPGTDRTLRPLQAIALQELFHCRGLFAPIRVGGGKSLITFLAPTVLPVIMISVKGACRTTSKSPFVLISGKSAKSAIFLLWLYFKNFQL